MINTLGDDGWGILFDVQAFRQFSKPFGKTGFGASLAYRVEGLPRYDLIGDSHGWCRPGYEMFAEPGIAYSRGGTTWTLNVSNGFYRNRQPNPYCGREGMLRSQITLLLTEISRRF